MSMRYAVHREIPRTDRRTDRRLAFGVFAAPLAWLVHEIAGLAIIGRHCQDGGDLAGWQWTALVILPVAAAGIALAGVIVAFSTFRDVRPDSRITKVEGWSRVEFVAVFGAFLSGLLLLNIIYFGVMPFVVEPCVRLI